MNRDRRADSQVGNAIVVAGASCSRQWRLEAATTSLLRQIFVEPVDCPRKVLFDERAIMPASFLNDQLAGRAGLLHFRLHDLRLLQGNESVLIAMHNERRWVFLRHMTGG